VFKSTDAGGSWAATGLGGGVLALAIDPSTPMTLYAGWVQCGFLSCHGGVSISTDAGGSWAGTGLGALFVRALVIDPSTPTTLYAGMASVNDEVVDRGVFKSTDAGGTWTAMNTGLYPDVPALVPALAINPSTPTTLYAGTGGGVFDIELTTTTSPSSSARCTLDAALASPACAGQTIPTRLTAKLTKAENLIDQAAMSPSKKAAKLLKKAKKALREAEGKANRAAKGKNPKLSSDCAAAIKDAADGVLAGLGV